MTEVRPISQSETGDFLRLLCGVFDLDYQRASAVFFSEPFYDLTHKWALFESGYMLSCLTTTPLMFGHGPAIGIAGVATTPDARRRGLASELVSSVIGRLGLPAMLFALDERLYEAIGFTPVDAVIRGELKTCQPEEVKELDSGEVKAIYASWSAQKLERLQRDERRWKFWQWHYRVCYPIQQGYMATEPGVLREAIVSTPVEALPIASDAEWLGLRSMAMELGLPIKSERFDMHVMTKGFDFLPSMFLTDQF